MDVKEEVVLDNAFVIGIKEELLMELKQEASNDLYETDDIDIKEVLVADIADIKVEMSDDDTGDFICSLFTKEDVESSAAEVDFIKKEMDIIEQVDTFLLKHNSSSEKNGHSNLIDHENIQIKCRHCDYKTTLKTNLRQHVNSFHEYNCHLCDYKATGKVSLRQHMQSVHESYTHFIHICELCNFKSIRKDNLRQHVQCVHDGVKYNCELCEYKTTVKGNLQRHVKSVHDGVKYNCELCDYKANRENHLRQHVKSVHVKYNCELCQYKSTRKCDLQRHVQSVHDKVKYNCDICDFKTSQETYLRQHVRSVHDDDIIPTRSHFDSRSSLFKCYLCDYKATFSNLQRHVNSIHGRLPKNYKLKLFCSRGCGSQFVNPDACDRHQSVCIFGQL